MGKPSAVTRVIAELETQKADLERQAALLGDMIHRLQMAQPFKQKKAVRTKLPKPGELRDRAILGGEPSL